MTHMLLEDLDTSNLTQLINICQKRVPNHGSVLPHSSIEMDIMIF